MGNYGFGTITAWNYLRNCSPTAWLRHLLLLCSLLTFQKDLRNYQGNCNQWQHQKSSNTLYGYQLDRQVLPSGCLLILLTRPTILRITFIGLAALTVMILIDGITKLKGKSLTNNSLP